MVLTGAVYHITLGFHASGKCESLAIEVVMFLVWVWLIGFVTRDYVCSIVTRSSKTAYLEALASCVSFWACKCPLTVV